MRLWYCYEYMLVVFVIGGCWSQIYLVSVGSDIVTRYLMNK